MRWLLDSPTVCGLYNVGTGAARSFRELITAMFAALGRAPAIDYVDMPEEIRPNYQYFTQADTANLRAGGFAAQFTPLEAAVTEYVTRYLSQADRYR
jgi:ADP-L-glycero-D-manno-heptose 6-epimerase